LQDETKNNLSAQIIEPHAVENRRLMSYQSSRFSREEADETIYWLDLLIESTIVEPRVSIR